MRKLALHLQMTVSGRNRFLRGALLAATIALGLASREIPSLFPAALGKYPGDALWAQMVYWVLAMVAPSASVSKLAVYSLAFSYCDEIGQLYRSPWLDQIRASAIGHIVLGSHFSWLDVLSYTIGISLVAPVDRLLLRRAENLRRLGR